MGAANVLRICRCVPKATSAATMLPKRKAVAAPSMPSSATSTSAGTRMAVERTTVMSTVAHTAVPHVCLREVHRRDRPGDRGDHQRREDVGRLLVLLAVERDDQVAARASRWPRRPPSARRPRRWRGAPGRGAWAPSRPPSARRAWPMAVGHVAGDRRDAPGHVEAGVVVGADVDQHDHRHREGRRLVGDRGGPVHGGVADPRPGRAPASGRTRGGGR